MNWCAQICCNERYFCRILSRHFVVVGRVWSVFHYGFTLGRQSRHSYSLYLIPLLSLVTNPQSHKVYSKFYAKYWSTIHLLAWNMNGTNFALRQHLCIKYISATSYDGKFRRSSSMNLPRHLYGGGGGGGGAILGARLRQLRQKREEEFHIKKAVIPIPRLGWEEEPDTPEETLETTNCRPS